MAAKKRKSNRNNRAGKICISMILVVFAAAMSVQIVKAYQKDQEYARKQEQLEVQLQDETAKAGGTSELPVLYTVPGVCGGYCEEQTGTSL